MGLFVIDLALAVDLFPEADPFLEATVGARPANHIFTGISQRALLEKLGKLCLYFVICNSLRA